MSEDHSQPKVAKMEVLTKQQDTGEGECQDQDALGKVDKCMTPAKEFSTTEDTTDEHEDNFCFSNTPTINLEELRKLNEKFLKDRNWHQFHTPRNVLLDLVGEVGELAEIFQWKGEVSEGLPELSQAEREHVGEEISDVLLCVIDFASRCRIDLPKAVASKMVATGLKYPVDKAYGRPNKYTDYQ